MSDVWEGGVAQRFVDRLRAAVAPTFATMQLIRPSGQELAKGTTIADRGYNACWQTASSLANGARAGADIIGLTRSFQLDHPRENEEAPRSDGVGMRLFNGTEEVGMVGLLGVPAREAVAIVRQVAQEFGMEVAQP